MGWRGAALPQLRYGFVEQETWEGDPYLCLKAAMTWLEGQIKQCKAQ